MDGGMDGWMTQALTLCRASCALWLDQSVPVSGWHRSFAPMRAQSPVPNDFSSNESVPGGFEVR